MTAIVRLGDTFATIEDGLWHSPDASLVMLCTAYAQNLGLHLYEPVPDLAAALRVIERFPDIELVDYTPADYVPGRIY